MMIVNNKPYIRKDFVLLATALSLIICLILIEDFPEYGNNMPIWVYYVVTGILICLTILSIGFTFVCFVMLVILFKKDVLYDFSFLPELGYQIKTDFKSTRLSIKKIIKLNHDEMTWLKFYENKQANIQQIKNIKKLAKKMYQGDYYTFCSLLNKQEELLDKYGGEVYLENDDVSFLFFGTFCHFLIEDTICRYEDVISLAIECLGEEKGAMAADIIYALTHEKGRDDTERMGRDYFKTINETQYAAFIRFLLFMAEISIHKRKVKDDIMSVKNEYNFLLAGLLINTDLRYSVSAKMVEDSKNMLKIVGCY